MKRHSARMREKGQLFSTDILIAISLVSLMLTLVFIYWTASSTEINSRQRRIDMQRATFDAGNYLTRVRAVNTTGELNETSLLSFGNCDYQTEKTNLGLSGFEYLINFSNTNNTQLRINNISIACGLTFENSSNLMVARRLAVYDGKEIIINVYVWK